MIDPYAYHFESDPGTRNCGDDGRPWGTRKRVRDPKRTKRNVFGFLVNSVIGFLVNSVRCGVIFC